MHPRSDSRRRALDILFSADLLDEPISEVLQREDRGRASPDDSVMSRKIDTDARSIVEGVAEHADQLNMLIGRYAQRWTIERMPIIDRNILRIAVFELLHCPQVPPGAAINDAVELAKMLSTEESGRFINGLLSRVHRERSAAAQT